LEWIIKTADFMFISAT